MTTIAISLYTQELPRFPFALVESAVIPSVILITICRDACHCPETDYRPLMG